MNSIFKILLLHDRFSSVYRFPTFPYKNAYFCSEAWRCAVNSMVHCQSFTIFGDITHNSLFSGDGKVKFSKLSLLLRVRGFSIHYNSQTPISETAFYYGLSQLAQLTQPNGNCSHTLTAETSSWSLLPKEAAVLCGFQLFLHSKAIICSQQACLWSVSRNPAVSLSITVRSTELWVNGLWYTQNMRNLLKSHGHQDRQPGTIQAACIYKRTLEKHFHSNQALLSLLYVLRNNLRHRCYKPFS